MTAAGQSIDKLVAEARMLKQRGMNKKAVEVYRKALEMDPENIDLLNEIGLILIHIGEQIGAIQYFDRAIAISPTDPRGYANKAEAYLTMGDFENALSVANAALEIITNSAEIWVRKARALESLLRIDEAIEAYHEALKYNSEDPEVWKSLALCLDAKERWPEVARAYRIAAGIHKKRGENQEADYCLRFAKMAEQS